MARPYVLKPINEGSSVGVAIVTSEGNYGIPIGRDVPGPWQSSMSCSQSHSSRVES